ncbi:rod-binding protein [Thaumasiovibrio sp. DFM-14]|uniref:rod-binding protein n=1 Tax=Thaumasiovibrio sp. DFM-14 TaxID=3384792 RepID=UPI0039A26608
MTVVTMPINPMAIQAESMGRIAANGHSLPVGTITTFDSRELENLKIADDQQHALEKVAEQFESMFLQMVLKQMRKASEAMGDDESMLRSRESKTYQEFFDGQISMEMAKRNTGLADVIVRQLGPQLGLDNSANESGLALKSEIAQVDLQQQKPAETAHHSAAFAQPLLSTLRKENDV